MENMLFIFASSIIISLFFWFIAILCSDVTDTVLFKRKTNIFLKWFPKEHNPSIYKYFCLDKDWWKRRYVDEDPTQGRKKFLGIIVPSLFFDAWHGFKWLRQLFYFQAIYWPFAPILGSLGVSFLHAWILNILIGIVFGLLTFFIHKKIQ